jgi:hypothetical protein
VLLPFNSLSDNFLNLTFYGKADERRPLETAGTLPIVFVATPDLHRWPLGHIDHRLFGHRLQQSVVNLVNLRCETVQLSALPVRPKDREP